VEEYPATTGEVLRLKQKALSGGTDNTLRGPQMLRPPTQEHGHHGIPANDGSGPPNRNETKRAAPERIDAEWWLTRTIEKPRPLLGEIITSTGRLLLGGPTGVGKTHLAMGMAGAMVTGNGFLHWRAPAEPSVWLYVDGEMPRDLLQERLHDLKRRMPGADLSRLHVLCREDFPMMEPLNTPDGHDFILAWAARIGAVGIIFDNRMSLLTGDMKEEIPWKDTMPLVLEITRRGMSQIWLDHTGHATDRIYGSKVKEWQMDTVALVHELPLNDADIRIKLEFTKHRRRRPDTRPDFEPVTITLKDDQWTAETTATITPPKAACLSANQSVMLTEIEQLIAGPDAQRVQPATISVLVVTCSRSLLRTRLMAVDFYPDSESRLANGKLTNADYALESNTLKTLKAKKKINFDRDLVWLT
jgi:hypothetical protein